MAEWHIDPVTVAGTWDEDLLLLMVRKRNDRIGREREQMEKTKRYGGHTEVPDTALFGMAGFTPGAAEVEGGV